MDAVWILTRERFQQGISDLTTSDADLAEALAQVGSPPYWTHASGLPGLVIDILSQQVSLESAQSTYLRLAEALGAITPEALLSAGDTGLKALGVTRQKCGYLLGVARDIESGKLDLDALVTVDNEEARARLIRIRGIGSWTAETYLLFALRRADAWPSGDLALAKAVQILRELSTPPSYDSLDRMATEWTPWRAVAARILWHYYLKMRRRAPSSIVSA